MVSIWDLSNSCQSRLNQVVDFWSLYLIGLLLNILFSQRQKMNKNASLFLSLNSRIAKLTRHLKWKYVIFRTLVFSKIGPFSFSLFNLSLKKFSSFSTWKIFFALSDFSFPGKGPTTEKHNVSWIRQMRLAMKWSTINDIFENFEKRWKLNI